MQTCLRPHAHRVQLLHRATHVRRCDASDRAQERELVGPGLQGSWIDEDGGVAFVAALTLQRQCDQVAEPAVGQVVL
jgi:hypothetical protein